MPLLEMGAVGRTGPLVQAANEASATIETAASPRTRDLDDMRDPS